MPSLTAKSARPKPRALENENYPIFRRFPSLFPQDFLGDPLKKSRKSLRWRGGCFSLGDAVVYFREVGRRPGAKQTSMIFRGNGTVNSLAPTHENLDKLGTLHRFDFTFRLLFPAHASILGGSVDQIICRGPSHQNTEAERMKNPIESRSRTPMVAN
jgi:hypothetical protein